MRMADVLERDAGFCSGGDEDDMEAEDGIHSPTDASEDSVDVKVQAISLRNRNKRKCAEPRKLDTDLPAKKRKIDLSVTKEAEPLNCSPFRPWSASPPSHHKDESSVQYPVTNLINLPLKSEVNTRTIEGNLVRGSNEFNVITPRLPTPPHSQYDLNPHTSGHSPSLIKVIPPHRLGMYSPIHQEEPLSLVSKRKNSESDDSAKVPNSALRLPKGKIYSNAVPDVRPGMTSPRWHHPSQKEFQVASTKTHPVGRVSDRVSYVSNRVKPGPANKTNNEKKVKTKPEEVSHQSDNKFRIDSLLSSVRTEGSSNGAKSSQGGQQRNYKNMTRERRIEANARERTRVHTISAAFDTLRHSIPAYSHNQKLSKLSVLRIACSYIMTLSRMAGYDYSKDQSEPDLSNCVENVSKTIQTEGKIRKKKDD